MVGSRVEIMKRSGINSEKRLYLTGGLVLLLLYSLNCFVVLPVCNVLASDVIFASNVVVSNLMSLLGDLVEITAISAFYAALLLTVYKYGAKRGAGALLVFALLTLYKYTANTVVSWAFDGCIPSSWVWDIINVIFFSALEMIQMVIVFSFAKGIITAYTEKRDMRMRAADRLGVERIDAADDAYPFTSLYNKSNCLLRSAFICAVITVIAKVAGSLISDVWVIVLYGLPEDPMTWVTMAISYGSKVIFGVVAYFVTVWGMTFFIEVRRGSGVDKAQ